MVKALPGCGAGLLEIVGHAGLVDDRVVLAENADNLLVNLAFLGDLVPEFLGGVLDLGPFGGGHRAEFQLVAVGAERGLAAPVPLVAVGMTGTVKGTLA